MQLRRNAAIVLILGALLAAGNTVAADEPEGQPPLEEFITSEFVHGVPYDQARAYGEESLPYLRAWLEDLNYKPHWANIAVTIGYIGSKEDFTTLRHLVVDRFSGEVDPATVQAVIAAMHGLAFIATESNEAMRFLVAATDPAYFRDLKWTSGGYSRGLKLSQFAINAISLTGRPEAEGILKRLEREPFDSKQLSNIREGLARNQEVKSVGRDEYYRNAQVGASAQHGK